MEAIAAIIVCLILYAIITFILAICVIGPIFLLLGVIGAIILISDKIKGE